MSSDKYDKENHWLNSIANESTINASIIGFLSIVFGIVASRFEFTSRQGPSARKEITQLAFYIAILIGICIFTLVQRTVNQRKIFFKEMNGNYDGSRNGLDNLLAFFFRYCLYAAIILTLMLMYKTLLPWINL
jgi:uncharacterized membrane protein YidH (DUF202 family)